MSARLSTRPPAKEKREKLDRHVVVVALTLVLGAFVAFLDTTVVGVAVHALATAFGADLADTQWATTGYLLALAAVIPATGWAARRFGALGAGAVLVPQGLGMLAAVLLIGRLVDATARARTLLLAGLGLVLLGTLPFALLTPGTGRTVLAAALFVRGVGLTVAVAPTMKTLYHSLPAERTAAATAANAIDQQLGGAVGTAAVAVVLRRACAGRGTTFGFHAAFWVTLGCSVLAAGAAPLLPDGNSGGPSNVVNVGDSPGI